jgi:phosphoribosylformylglycinamidine synthase
MLHNDSQKHSTFYISNGSRKQFGNVIYPGKHFRCMGFTWEGKFNLPEPEENYTIVSKYAYIIQQILMVLILMRLCYVTEQVTIW